MRTFIAIELPPAIGSALAALIERLRRSGVRAAWVRPENIHLTLRFLGEIDEASANRLGERLALSYQDVKPFHLFVRGAGVFPNLRRPAVLWAGVEPLEGGLRQVQSIAESGAAFIGLAAEARLFNPHLTIARIRDPREAGSLDEYIASERGFDGGAFHVAGVSLFSSQLTPKGPVYRRLREFRL